MKVLLELSEKDFENMRALDKSANRQLGNVYVGTNSMCVYFDYPNALAGLLRPKAGNAYLSAEEYEKFQNQLKTGSVIFELESSKPQ